MGQAAEHVFYLDAVCNHEIVYGFRSELLLRDEDAGRENYAAFNRGELSYEDMPDRISLWEQASHLPPSPLPHVFVAGDYLAISNAVADVLQAFDLGASLIKPVVFLNKNQKTPLARGWNLFQIKEFKSGLEIEHSENMPKQIFPRAEIYPIFFDRHKENTRPAMNRTVLDGADVWIDRRVGSSVFVSAEILVRLRDRKLLGLVKYIGCPVLNPDNATPELES